MIYTVTDFLTRRLIPLQSVLFRSPSYDDKLYIGIKEGSTLEITPLGGANDTGDGNSVDVILCNANVTIPYNAIYQPALQADIRELIGSQPEVIIFGFNGVNIPGAAPMQIGLVSAEFGGVDFYDVGISGMPVWSARDKNPTVTISCWIMASVDIFDADNFPIFVKQPS